MHFALPRHALARQLVLAPLFSNAGNLPVLPPDFLRRPIAALTRLAVAGLARPGHRLPGLRGDPDTLLILGNATLMRALNWSHWHREAVPANR